MQVPPQLSAFQMLLGTTDGSAHLPHDMRGDLLELSESPDAAAATSFISVIAPLLQPDQTVAPNNDLTEPTVTAPAPTDAFATTDVDAPEPKTASSERLTLSAEHPVHSQSIASPQIDTSGEVAGTHDAPQLADPSATDPSRIQPAEANQVEAYRSDVIADSSTLDPRVLHKSTNVHAPLPDNQPSTRLPVQRSDLAFNRMPDHEPRLPSQPSTQSQTVESIGAATANEADDSLHPTITRPSPTRSSNSAQVVEQAQASTSATVAQLDVEQRPERVAEAAVPDVNRTAVERRNQANQVNAGRPEDIENAAQLSTNRNARPVFSPGTPQASPPEASLTQDTANQQPETVQVEHEGSAHRQIEGVVRTTGERPIIADVSPNPTLYADMPTASSAGTVHDLGDLGPSIAESAPTSASTSSTTVQPTSTSGSNTVVGGLTANQSVEIAAQIVEAVHLEAAMESQRSPRLEVQLDPPELGKVWIELSEARDGLVAKITVSRGDTHQLLEAELAQIRASLDEAGVQVSDFQVGHDQSRFQDESQASMTRSWLKAAPAEVEDDGRDVDHQQVNRYGPQGSRIDVRL